MYKIERGGGNEGFMYFFNIICWGGGLNNELSDMKSSDCNRLDDFEIFII